MEYYIYCGVTTIDEELLYPYTVFADCLSGDPLLPGVFTL